MRSVRLSAVLAVALWGCLSPVSAEPDVPKKPDPFAAGPLEAGPVAEAFVRFEVFELPPDLSRQVQRRFPRQADLYSWLVLEMEKPGAPVKLERMDILRIRGGQRSKLESVDEYPYPTEYDPSQIPQTIGLGMPASENHVVPGIQVPDPQIPKPMVPPAPGVKPAPGTPPGSPAPATPPGARGDASTPGPAGDAADTEAPVLPSAFPKPGPPGSIPARAVPPWPYTQTTPTAYATKNTGWTYEVEFTLSEDGRTADLNVSPQFIKLSGIESHSINAEEIQPRFECRQLTCQMSAPVDKPTLVGSFNRAAETGGGGAKREASARLMFATVTLAATPGQGVAGPGGDPFATPAEAEQKEDPPGDPFSDPAKAAPPSQPVRNEVIVRFEAFSLPLKAARNAAASGKNECDLYGFLDAELGRNGSGVSLDHASTVRVRGGQRAKSEAILEFPYATEMDPPQIPQTISMLPGLKPISIPGTESVFTPWPFTATNGSAFATKNLGWIISLEATLSSGDRPFVDLNLAPEEGRVVHKLLYGICQDIMQPVFETRRSTCQLLTVPGRPSLVGTFSLPTGTGVPGGNTAERTCFLFLTSTLPE